MLFCSIISVFIIITAIDTGRVPWDITEAESELIAGTTNEHSGIDFR